VTRPIGQRTTPRLPQQNGRNGRLAQLKRQALSNDQIMVTEVGLEISQTVDFDTWEQAGRKIARIAESSTWCLGDWLIYGQDQYADRYRLAIDSARLDYQTLRNYAWIARRFEPSRRRTRLSFQHHAEVAALPPEDQDRWLDLAEGKGWSRNELRKNIRASTQGQEIQAASSTLLPRLYVSAEHLSYWREAAKQLDQDFPEWVVAVLNESAKQAFQRGECD
jgi:hypothetical protein